MQTQTIEREDTMVEQEFQGFVGVEPAIKPDLLCIGYIGEVGDAKESSSQVYIVQPISIEGYEAARGQRTNLLYRPEYLTPSFDASGLDSSQSFVYKKNIVKGTIKEQSLATTNLPVLPGLGGTREGTLILLRAIVGLGNDVNDMAAVTNVIRSFITKYEPTIGYVLSQAREKTDDIDEATGKYIYRRLDKYEVGSYFYPTKETKEKQAKRAEKSQGKVILTFEV